MKRLAVLTAIITCIACGGSDHLGPTDQGDGHERIVIESIPYDVIGQSRLTFRRFLDVVPVGAGMVTLDGSTKTAATHFSHSVLPIEASPDGSSVVYLTATDYNNKQRQFDVSVSGLDSPAQTDLAGPGGGRRFPSWTPDGSKVVYAESEDWSGSFPTKIVSQSPTPGAARDTLWQAAGCERVESPHANGAGDIVFIYYPVLPNCVGEAHIARKKPGQATEIVYGPGSVLLYTPAWSPDGTEIAFFEQPAPQAVGPTYMVDLKAMSADGSNVRTLSTVQSYVATENWSLCWGADGSALFFSLGDSPTEAHIYAVPATGGTAVAVTTQAAVADESVSCPR